MGLQNGVVTLEKNFVLTQNGENELLYDPGCIYPGELKTHVHTKTCTGIFPAALFAITNTSVNCSNVHQLLNGEIKCVLAKQYNII